MWPNSQFPVDLVTFTEQFFNETLHFLCSDMSIESCKIYYSRLKAYITVTEIFDENNSTLAIGKSYLGCIF